MRGDAVNGRGTCAPVVGLGGVRSEARPFREVSGRASATSLTASALQRARRRARWSAGRTRGMREARAVGRVHVCTQTDTTHNTHTMHGTPLRPCTRLHVQRRHGRLRPPEASGGRSPPVDLAARRAHSGQRTGRTTCTVSHWTGRRAAHECRTHHGKPHRKHS